MTRDFSKQRFSHRPLVRRCCSCCTMLPYTSKLHQQPLEENRPLISDPQVQAAIDLSSPAKKKGRLSTQRNRITKTSSRRLQILYILSSLCQLYLNRSQVLLSKFSFLVCYNHATPPIRSCPYFTLSIDISFTVPAQIHLILFYQKLRCFYIGERKNKYEKKIENFMSIHPFSFSKCCLFVRDFISLTDNLTKKKCPII